MAITQTLPARGVYHTGNSELFLTGKTAELYRSICKCFLAEFDDLDGRDYELADDFEDVESWQIMHDREIKNSICTLDISTGIKGFDFQYTVAQKKQAVKHVFSLLTETNSNLPSLGYSDDPLRVTAEGLAIAPFKWLQTYLTNKPDFLEFFIEDGIINLLWEVANEFGFFLDNTEDDEFDYASWRSDYPENEHDESPTKWALLCDQLADLILDSQDADWRMIFHPGDVYEEYVKSVLSLTTPIIQQANTQTEEMIGFVPGFSIKKLAKVLLGDHSNLPDSPGIYFALDASNRVWYVGISTTSLRDRHAQHEKLTSFKANKVQHIAYHTWTDVQELHEWELGFIQKFDPPLNMNLTKKDLPQIDLGYSEAHYISRYREIKQQIALLTQEMEELKPNLVTLLEREGGKIADTTRGFSGYIQSRKSWQYSLDLEARKEAVKLLQKQEEESGIAVVKSLNTYPVFRFK